MKGFKTILSIALALGFSSTSLIASTTAASQTKKCEWECPFWGMEEMEHYFNHPFPRINSFSSAIKENDKAYLINIDLPGMDKKDISIETSGNRLMISGERKEDSEKKESVKCTYQQFQQNYLLPDDANLEAITATSTNGVLKITVPKTGKKVSKKIEIK
jgi:HSP20 family protein